MIGKEYCISYILNGKPGKPELFTDPYVRIGAINDPYIPIDVSRSEDFALVRPANAEAALQAFLQKQNGKDIYFETIFNWQQNPFEFKSFELKINQTLMFMGNGFGLVIFPKR